MGFITLFICYCRFFCHFAILFTQLFQNFFILLWASSRCSYATVDSSVTLLFSLRNSFKIFSCFRNFFEIVAFINSQYFNQVPLFVILSTIFVKLFCSQVKSVFKDFFLLLTTFHIVFYFITSSSLLFFINYSLFKL